MATAKEQRRGKTCHVGRITLTFRKSVDHNEGLYLLCLALLRQPKSFIDYVFFPEYGANSNFHVHGTVWYTNVLHWHAFLANWKKNNGFFHVSKPGSESLTPLHWHIYCMKDQSQWKQLRINKSNLKHRFKRLAVKCM